MKTNKFCLRSLINLNNTWFKVWIGLCVLWLIGIVIYAFGKYQGRMDAYVDFSSDKCWVQKDTRDIVCVQKVKD